MTSSNQLSVVEMDDKIFKLSKEIAEDEDAVKKAEAELKSLTSSMTCAEASSELEMVHIHHFFPHKVNLNLFSSQDPQGK